MNLVHQLDALAAVVDRYPDVQDAATLGRPGFVGHAAAAQTGDHRRAAAAGVGLLKLVESVTRVAPDFTRRGIAHVADGVAELPAAFARAKDADRSYVIVIDVAQYEWVGGGTWWEVGVPEVSERAEVRVARAEWAAESKHQRAGL